jgi:hypothetical protein
MSLTFAEWSPVIPVDGEVVVKEVRAYVIGDKKLEEKSGGGGKLFLYITLSFPLESNMVCSNPSKFI